MIASYLTKPRPGGARRPRLAGILPALLIVAVACTSSPSTAPTSSPVGVYGLEAIGDVDVPAELHHGPWFQPESRIFYNQFILTITGGGVELEDDGHFVMWFDMSAIGDGVWLGEHTGSIDGTYTVQGSTIRFHAVTPDIGDMDAQLGRGTIALALDFMGKGAPLDYTFRR